MNDFKAQEWVDKNLTDKNIKTIKLSPLAAKEVSWKKDVIAVEGNLAGDLIFRDYLECEEIGIKNHKLTSLVIINCPNLKHLNVRNNQLTKLELERVKTSEDNKRLENEIDEIIAGENNLSVLDLVTCPKVKELMVPDNPVLTEIKNLNWSSIRNINLTNTLFSLAQETNKLRQENKNLYDIIRKIDEAGQERKLVFTEEVRTSLQTDEAINRLLVKTELDWRAYFDSENKGEDVVKKYPLLNLSFKHPEKKYRAKQILIEIIYAQRSRKYDDLLKEWNKGEKYNSADDYDGSLDSLIMYTRVKEILGRGENKGVIIN